MEKVWVYSQSSYNINEIKNLIKKSDVLDIIKKTDTVCIKPNFVQESRNQDDDWEYVITHPTIIQAVIELVSDILSSHGKIVVADAPMTGSSFSKIISHMPINEWKKCCDDKNIPFEIIDLRDEEWKMADNGVILNRTKLKGDPNGKLLVNLKSSNSEFFDKPKTSQKLYGADYNIEETNNAHNGLDNFYSVSKTVIKADVIINLPKLKTHKKAGITCCLKNMVGINTNKNLLPHHTIGTPKNGGDQFESSSSGTEIESLFTMAAKNFVTKFKVFAPILVPLKKMAILFRGDNKHTLRSGGWYGNDTLWRTILDLNKVMFYSREDGNFSEDKKRYIGIVDAIQAGQGNGPVEPDRIDCGKIICGFNPVAIDCVATKIMHFDYMKIPQLKNAFLIKNYKLIDCQYKDIIVANDDVEKTIEATDFPIIEWRSAFGWENHIE